jgi:XapX domain-containing protein
MEPYIFSLLAGVLAGVVYSLIRVRSPAPPIIALVGLLGMVIGGQVIPISHQLTARAEAQSRGTDERQTSVILEARAAAPGRR